MYTEYIVDIIILLTAAVLVVPLFQYLKLGVIPGFLIAGIIIGPSGLAYIENNDEISHLAELGVVFLLFVIGIEINPSRLMSMKRLVLGLGTLQVIVTGTVITVLARLLTNTSWEVSLLIGLALSLSSTAFVLQLLSDRKALSSDYGRPSLSVLLLQDLAVVPLLAFVSLMATPESTVGADLLRAIAEAVLILLLVVVGARYVLNPLLGILSRLGSPEIFTASALLLVLGSAQAMASVGLSLAMGAFVAGILIADSSYRHQIVAEIQPFRGLLLGLFFITMGMTLNLDILLGRPLQLLLVVVGLIVVKFLVLLPLSRLFKVKTKSALAASFMLAQSGEFALVLFAMANSLNLLDEALFQQLIIIVILSMLLTPLLEKLALHFYQKSDGNTSPESEIDIDLSSPDRRPAVIAGFGRMGKRIAYILDSMDVPYVAIENNASVVEKERAEGRAVYFGDARRPELLRAVGIGDTPFVVISIDDLHAAESVVATIHSAFPDVPVFARAHDLAKCKELGEFGAYFTVSETLEASAELARAALLHMGSEEMDVEAALNQFRTDYYGRLNESKMK